ncbi:MAG: hypothetical protein M1838_006028 [Thelocarpon superellum]|nr:MAG: hypothetical protein M1838_006028 [Thelocarpon superellum]
MAPSAVPIPEPTDLTTNAILHKLSEVAHPPAKSANGEATIPAPLDASKTQVTRTTAPRPVPLPTSAEVWETRTCTDHMVTVQWKASTGWETPQLRPYGPLSLWPTTSVLHYATECFEGLKAYRGFDGKLRLFRPDRNCARMLMSATRIALPAFPPEEMQKLITHLMAIDGPKWLPESRPGSFIYLRPTMIGTDAALGVRRPGEAMMFIIATCFPSFDEPKLDAGPITSVGPLTDVKQAPKAGMKLFASKEDSIRAWVGGFGYAKLGANYGPTLVAQAEARALGYDQVLWLLEPEGYVTEGGASNFFVVWRTRSGQTQLVTAPLDDKIVLDGVTRRSVLDLAKERLATAWTGDDGPALPGLEIVERKFRMAEVQEAVEEGRMLEAFVSGTAFFITGIRAIHYRGVELAIPMANEEKGTGLYAGAVKTWLKNIMYGVESHPWGVVVDEEEGNVEGEQVVEVEG